VLEDALELAAATADEPVDEDAAEEQADRRETVAAAAARRATGRRVLTIRR
jgi:uncharacterized protein YegJ (DUF2314 family)